MASDELQSKDGLPPAPETTGRTLYDAYTYTLSALGWTGPHILVILIAGGAFVYFQRELNKAREQAVRVTLETNDTARKAYESIAQVTTTQIENLNSLFSMSRDAFVNLEEQRGQCTGGPPGRARAKVARPRLHRASPGRLGGAVAPDLGARAPRRVPLRPTVVREPRSRAVERRAGFPALGASLGPDAGWRRGIRRCIR
jgi:hypothetical protein